MFEIAKTTKFASLCGGISKSVRGSSRRGPYVDVGQQRFERTTYVVGKRSRRSRRRAERKLPGNNGRDSGPESYFGERERRSLSNRDELFVRTLKQLPSELMLPLSRQNATADSDPSSLPLLLGRKEIRTIHEVGSRLEELGVLD